MTQRLMMPDESSPVMTTATTVATTTITSTGVGCGGARALSPTFDDKLMLLTLFDHYTPMPSTSSDCSSSINAQNNLISPIASNSNGY